MKRKSLFLVVAILIVSFQSKAQLGVHLGYNFSKIDGASFTGFDEKYLSNLSGGVFYDKDIIPLLDIRLGVMYSPKGSHFTSGDSYYKTVLNYIEIPIQAKVKVSHFYALGGFYGAYAINGKAKSRTEILNIVYTTDDDLDFENEEIKKIDFGMKFGAGVQFGIGPVNIFAQGEYSFGLQNINDDKNGDELKNNVLAVSAGILIGF